MKNVWLIEKHDPADGDDVEWEQYSLGICEDGFFRPIGVFYSEEDAVKFRAAIQWLESLESGILCAPPDTAIKPKPKARARSKS